MGKVEFVDAANFTRGLKGARHVTAATYLRLFADQVMPPETERVLFLDADTMAIADLSELYHLDLHGNAVAAARDMVIADSDHPYSGSVTRGSADPYFNAGVLLIDLVRWRREGIGDELRAYARERPGHGNFDQEALNDILRHDWLEVDPIWNVQRSLLLLHEHPRHDWVETMRRRRAEILKSARLVHFSGGLKPWEARSRHPYRKAWRRGLLQSGWLAPGEYARWMLRLRGKSAAFELAVIAGRRKPRERVTG